MKITSLAPFLTLLLLWGCGGAGLGPPAASPAAQPASQHAAPPPATVNWPQSYHDAGRTSYNPSETILSGSNVSKLGVLWGQSVAGGVTGFALESGVIYAQGQGTSASNLAAITATTGATRWTITTGNSGLSGGTVASAKGSVFAGCSVSDSFATYGGLCAYKASTGSMLWQYADTYHCLPASGMAAPAVYSSGLLYFGYNHCGSGPYIAAVDAATGNRLWFYRTGGPNTLGSNTPAVGGGYVYFGCNGNNFKGVCALQQSNGSLVWSTATGDPSTAVTFSNGVVYAAAAYGSTQNVTALNASTGATLWTFSYAGGNNGARPVAVAKGIVYLSGTDGKLYALRAKTGHRIWSGNGGGASDVDSSPSIANGVLYVDGGTNDGGEASAHDASTGNLLWSAPHGKSTLNPPPIVANGMLYTPNTTNCSMSGDSVCAWSVSALRR
ncbi:MAG: PQQ-binding-like beta-propeller repeat protein [Candidatus Eremiobacteraeota bacterium]|nr:PQQ-binding-like beta-propeller repeat protein [Candidatus Eremiobacteraeota bacterium]MBV9055496.1 PQQ-binding-like beta-propeller repeat protein [Candidatus Eremiobacteraeota bacterium]MBV9699075.1 PQQ-binding-like beta-propeller repeat protein [Candidatus Eremiobacteraeota bacterium]